MKLNQRTLEIPEVRSWSKGESGPFNILEETLDFREYLHKEYDDVCGTSYLSYKEFVDELVAILGHLRNIMFTARLPENNTDNLFNIFFDDTCVFYDLGKYLFDVLQIRDLDYTKGYSTEEFASAFNSKETRISLIKLFNDVMGDRRGCITQYLFIDFIIQILDNKLDDLEFSSNLLIARDGETEFCESIEFLHSLINGTLSKGVNGITKIKLPLASASAIEVVPDNHIAASEGEMALYRLARNCMSEGSNLPAPSFVENMQGVQAIMSYHTYYSCLTWDYKNIGQLPVKVLRECLKTITSRVIKEHTPAPVEGRDLISIGIPFTASDKTVGGVTVLQDPKCVIKLLNLEDIIAKNFLFMRKFMDVKGFGVMWSEDTVANFISNLCKVSLDIEGDSNLNYAYKLLQDSIDQDLLATKIETMHIVG